ncbi:MAG TPA: hypothetical protein VH280_16290 [Verrucomicrobiae bacterium]|jgi:hypothetical protein|nr:hypothetical protein [Verrucomicrobiae bacterium]
MKWKNLLLALPAIVVTGCAGTFTNLTPLEQARNANNLYPVEVAFTSPETVLRWDSIHPYVLVNGQLYDMHATPLMTNRWEGFVPATPGGNTISYRYKFDYKYNDFSSHPKPSSAFSPAYNLEIVEPQ